MDLRTFFLLCMALILAGCDDNEHAISVDLSRTEQVIFRETPDVITYAYLPQYSHRVSYTRHQALVRYLRKETGLNIRQIFPDNFDQHMKMVGDNKIHISFSNPFIYVKIARRYGAHAFARIVEATKKETFRGQVITRTDNTAIQTLGDCRGKTWIAVDPTSAGGYLFPLGHFFSHGITKADFKEIAFAPGPGGKQEKVILSVFAGKYDLGTIREGALDVVAGKIDVAKIRIVSRTPTYPGWVYAAVKTLDNKSLDKIRTALVKLDFNQKDHREILEAANFVNVIPAMDADFDSVRQLTGRLGMEMDQ
ncbi:MAG: phosphate/phosphite/phosphonate ABC transporter substrate-binding protein [Desulfobacter sp.]|nr:MAG: phosphate/phosphite/phosphonate ABC transporter substrate-binding protein [Desulfobacter sp.]